jgi:hypothetical protein
MGDLAAGRPYALRTVRLTSGSRNPASARVLDGGAVTSREAVRAPRLQDATGVADGTDMRSLQEFPGYTDDDPEEDESFTRRVATMLLGACACLALLASLAVITLGLTDNL